MIVIAIIVTYLTAGAASGAIGSAAGATAGSGTAMAAGTAATATAAATSVGWANIALTAVATSATSNAAISVINNQGDLGAVLKDVTSNALKGYATSAAVAGLAGYTDSWGRELTVDGNYKLVNATDRLKAYAANTALKGLLSGKDDAKSWLTIAGAGAMMELYQYSVGREPDARPGVDRPEGAEFTPLDDGFIPRVTADGVIREGKNIGLNRVDGCGSFYSVCHGTPISNTLDNVPGFNAFSTLQDQWMINLEAFKGGNMSVFENLGSMPPALLVNYGSMYDWYRLLIESNRKSNAK